MDNFLFEMINYFDTDIRRINHALKVYGYAKCIAKGEQLNSTYTDTIEIAAIFHDIGIPVSERKYGTSMGKYQEIEGPPIAREILEKADVDQEVVERVCFLIGHHHSYTKIDDIDFQVLVEADFLVNIDEDKMSIDAIESIKQKYFKTNTGTQILNSMYIAGEPVGAFSM